MIKMMGMISKSCNESGTGTLVLSNGDIREFTKEDWIDKELEPGIGQKVLFQNDHNGTQIRTITEEELVELRNNPVEEETAAEEPLSDNEVSSLEEAIEHYSNLGFKTARDGERNGIRTISMRYYDQQGEFGEALISVNGSTIEIKETRNGKPV